MEKTKTQTLTLKSEFHPGVMATFRGLVPGINIRKIRNRGKYCMDYSNNNSHVCGCGYPLSRTDQIASDGSDLLEFRECGADGEEYGRGYFFIKIN